MKPRTAPTAIIPSTPRLRTPDRSATSSPRAANRRGIEAATMVSPMPWISSMATLHFGCSHQPRWDGPDKPDAIENERVAGEDEKEEKALGHARDLLGHTVGYLHALAAEIRQGKDETGEDDGQRVEAPEKR